MMTPWGMSDSEQDYGSGVKFYGTPGHGGFYVAPAMNALIPAVFKRASFCKQGFRGWYEEDIDWAIPVWFLQDKCMFDESQVLAAKNILKEQYSEAWNELYWAQEELNLNTGGM